MDHSQFCVWEITIPEVCVNPFAVKFTIGATEAELLLPGLGMATVTYRGPPPTGLLDTVNLSKIMGMDFCTGFPGSIVVSPVCD